MQADRPLVAVISGNGLCLGAVTKSLAMRAFNMDSKSSKLCNMPFILLDFAKHIQLRPGPCV
jgi:hypothetical protein